MLALLLACAARAPSPAAPAPDAPADGTPARAADAPARAPDHPAADARPLAERVRAALLAEDHEAWTPWRATVTKIGPYELVPGRQVFSPEPLEATFDCPVVADEGDVVRLVDETGGIRMVIGVGREDLARRPVERTKLALDPAGAPGDTYAEVAGGTPVTVLEAHAGASRVAWAAEGLTVGGWVRDGALGEVWRAAPYEAGERWADLELVAWEEGAPIDVPLHTRPDFGSPILARLTPDTPLLLFAAGPAQGGWQPLEALTTHARAVGWAPPGATRTAEPYGAGWGSGGGTPGYTERPLVELPAGTWLRARGATEPFARTVREVRLPLAEDGGATVRVRFTTRWGRVEGALDCPRRTPTDTGFRCDGA